MGLSYSALLKMSDEEHVDNEGLPAKPQPEEEQLQEATETLPSEEQEQEQNIDVIYKFRDIGPEMVQAWDTAFENYPERLQVSFGEIFEGAPGADAVVSPANSFGFMDGGIDMVYSKHFGWQMQERLQEIIRTEKDGELLVGDAIIMPTFEGGATMDSMDWSKFNEGQPIKWLVSAPTMRIPMLVKDTVNAYLAFRAVILAVQRHNRDPKTEKIRSVLVPGFGTGVGHMPPHVCANQMLQAYETFVLDLHPERWSPQKLINIARDHIVMADIRKKKTPLDKK